MRERNVDVRLVVECSVVTTGAGPGCRRDFAEGRHVTFKSPEAPAFTGKLSRPHRRERERDQESHEPIANPPTTHAAMFSKSLMRASV